MKKMTLALVVSLFSLSAWSASFVTCDGITSNRILFLSVKNAQLVQVRVQTEGSLPRAFAVKTLSNDGDTSFFSLLGTTDIAQVENSVLELNGGLVNIGSEKFICEAL